MRQLNPYSLWIGHVADADDLERISQLGIQAIVDLADNEKPRAPTFRDVVYCRVPLVDGSENPEWLVRLAVETVVRLLHSKVSTLVFCSAGLSRSPAIAATAISIAEGKPLSFGLGVLRANGTFDLSPSLWSAIEEFFR